MTTNAEDIGNVEMPSAENNERDLSFRSRHQTAAVLIVALIACISLLYVQRREISRLEHINQLLQSDQKEMQLACAASLESLRVEMQAKFDASTATSSRIHQLELDK